jgi:quercetin dioxygenase-like cupin family protein
MTVASAVRLPIVAAVEPLLADLASIPAGAWVPHFNTQQYDGDWSGVPLRIAEGSPLALYPDPTSDRYTDTELLERCPAVRSVLAQLECPLQTVRLLRLGPGAEIREHRDHRLGYADGEVRLHLPITSGPDVTFWVDGEVVPLAEGELWYLDLSRMHRVVNAGDSDRVHLVVDCVVDDWLTAQIHAGACG